MAVQSGQGVYCWVAHPLHPGAERGGILLTPGLVPLSLESPRSLPSLESEITLSLKRQNYLTQSPLTDLYITRTVRIIFFILGRNLPHMTGGSKCIWQNRHLNWLFGNSVLLLCGYIL